MSSSLSLAKQAVKERLGRSTVTLDEQFNISWAHCQQLEEVVDRVHRHMVDYIDAMKALCVAGHAVADDFKSFYERQPDRLTTIAIRYEQIQNGFRTEKIALLERLVNQNVFLKVEELKVELAALRSKVADREVSRKKYDHYLAKLKELREEVARLKAKGKEKSGDLEKLARNEGKFEDARLEYVAINHLVARNLWQTWSKRYAILDPIYSEVVKIKANFTQALSNQLQGILAPLKGQMMVELREEVVPAVFGGQAAGRRPGNGLEDHPQQQPSQQGVDEDGLPRGGVMSPGGSSEMDSRQLAARMTVAGAKLDADARSAAQRQAEKLAKSSRKAGMHSRPDAAQGELDAEQELDHSEEDDDEEDREERARRKAKAKRKAEKAAAVAAAQAAAAALQAKPKKAPRMPTHDDTEEEDTDTASEDEATTAARKAAAAAKAKKATATGAAPAAMAGAKKASSSGGANTLDFFAEQAMGVPAAAAAAPKSGASKKATSGAPAAAGGGGGAFDLLSFAASPQKSTPAAQQPFLDFAMAPVASTSSSSSSASSLSFPKMQSSAPARGRLELDAFFGGSAGALMPPADQRQQANVPDVNDPFFNLPSASPSAPVDLLSVMPTQAVEPPPAAVESRHAYNAFARQPSLSSTNTQPGLYHAPSIGTPGGAAAAGGAASSTLDDPFFTAPLPLPVSPLPVHTAAAVGGAPGRRGPVKKPAHHSSDSDSSDISSDSESEQEEGRPPPSARAKPASTSATAASAAAAAPAPCGPAAAAGVDPFDFDAHPTPSQLSALSSSSGGRTTAAANRSASDAAARVQSPKKSSSASGSPAMAAAPRLHASQSSALGALARAAPSPHGPPVPGLPPGGLPHLHVATAASASSSQQAPPPQTPEEYSPTRETFNPHADDSNVKSDDPFGGVNEDW